MGLFHRMDGTGVAQDGPGTVRPGGNSQFVATRSGSTSGATLSELLSDEPKLLGHAQQLEEAELDADLVSELSLADLRELLPAAPAAHCLLLRRRLSESRSLRPVIPDTPAWAWPARVIATGVCEGNLKDQALVKHEFDLIGGSLFLSFAIGPLLSPPSACADGSVCSSLLAADLLCWVCLTTCLLLCVVSSWSTVAIEQGVASGSMARWVFENWKIFNLGGLLMVASFTFLPVALSTRSAILLHGSPAHPPWLVWAVMGVLAGGGIVLQYTWWVIICGRTFGVKLGPDFVAFNLGLLGLRMPTRQLEGAPENTSPPYME